MKTSFPIRAIGRVCAIAVLTTVAAGAAVAQSASVGLTRGAVAVTTTMGSRYPVSQLIDQSGLSTPYVSGVTPFDAYVTSATHNSGTISTIWVSADKATGFLSFDLGAAYNIDGLAWFALQAAGTARVTAFKVYADNDSDATNGNAGLLFDSGTFGAAPTNNLTKPNLFSFSSAANTRYLDIEIVSNFGSGVSGLGEVVFRESLAAPVAAVPEPQSWALMGLGLLAVGGLQRRRTAPR